jgi:hypothetical protein
MIGPPGGRWTDANGAPLNAGLVYVYLAGTTTPDVSYPTYDDAVAGTNANANPVVLSSAGMAQIWLQARPDVLYKIVVKDSTAATTYQTVDDYNPSLAFPIPSLDQWVKETNAVAYSSTVLFTVTGIDVTSRYVPGRRVKVAVTAGTLYGTVSDSSFSTNTTVRVVMDSGVLDSGLSSVYYGLLTPTTQGTSPPSLGDRKTLMSAYTAGAQAVTTGAFRKLTFDTKTKDVLTEYDAVTNNRWTPLYQSSAAYNQAYLITAQAKFASSITSAEIAIYKNGSAIRTAKANQGLAGSTLSITAVEEGQASTGNYYEIFVQVSGNTDITGGSANTFFHVARI